MRKKGEKNKSREEKKVGRDKQENNTDRRKPVMPREGAKSSINNTLSQLTQLFLCLKFSLISLYYLLSANHFSSCQLFSLLF